MDNNHSHIGEVVYSKAGRDRGKPMIVMAILDESYVLVCNGSLRTVQKPKKKKIKHLVFAKTYAEDSRKALISGEAITNNSIKKFLQSYDNN